jgi:hypothetical protein
VACNSFAAEEEAMMLKETMISAAIGAIGAAVIAWWVTLMTGA